ncbi:glycolate oxidase subunit GlcE [Duganella radicis]|uniref:Glycolate oxidase subunit GlcE n=1 Tax=Duganella radicis TaxID=551988 RepID=A0A6L6PQB5_9BURK|nr:glycolate oxidase subunit GlcE [Duganella radicis]MTV41092.1 glycolate oxidase subunit GlcE [Duganella radicis]
MQQVLQSFVERIARARASGRPLRLRGGGSKDWYGQAGIGEVLDTRAYSGIVAYEPTELVVTARCGTPLSELEALLDWSGQMLAFEPPRFAGATVGGAVASGLSGPRRQRAGALRDFVLGTSLLDSTGTMLRFGGQVMKNVAGYDVSRLLAGSLGTLGLILEVSLKVLPKPACETTLRFAVSEQLALNYLATWAGQAWPISATCWHDGVLAVRLSGAELTVRAAARALGGADCGPDGEYWQALRDQRWNFFQPDEGAALWRLAVPATTPALGLAGDQLIEWGGTQRWLRTDASAAPLRASAKALGGHATLFRGGDKDVGVFQPLTAGVALVHRRLKHSFDPSGIFNPGRMYKGL